MRIFLIVILFTPFFIITFYSLAYLLKLVKRFFQYQEQFFIYFPRGFHTVFTKQVYTLTIVKNKKQNFMFIKICAQGSGHIIRRSETITGCSYFDCFSAVLVSSGEPHSHCICSGVRGFRQKAGGAHRQSAGFPLPQLPI